MEVRIEAEGCELPEGSCICVRVGDVQKQTAYDPKKVYRFPEARRFGKIDLYQRVGTCEIQWGLDEPESRVCQLVSSNGETGACLKVNMNRPATSGKTVNEQQAAKTEPTSTGGAAAEKARDVSAKAKAYLVDHDIEGIFTHAMRSLLRAMPEDPAGFLRDHIGHSYTPRVNKQTGTAKHGIEPLPQPLPVTTRPACLGPTFNAYYRKHMLHSRASSFLPDFHARASWRPPPREEPAASVANAGGVSSVFALTPSVGSWVNPSLSNPVTMAAAKRCPAPQLSLRVEARQCLLRAAEDGSLQEALLDISGLPIFGQGSSTSIDEKEDIRRQAGNMLVAASVNGSLDNALLQYSLEALRERARDAFINAHRNGSLHTAWAEVKRSQEQGPGDALRLKFRDLFLNASSNGNLEDVLSQVATEISRESVEAQSGNAVTELRAQACASFSKATLEGTLEPKLKQALDRSEAAILPFGNYYKSNILRCVPCSFPRDAKDGATSQPKPTIPELVAALDRSSHEDTVAAIKDVPVDRRKVLLAALEDVARSQPKPTIPELVAAIDRSSKEDMIAAIKDVPVDQRKLLLAALKPYEDVATSQPTPAVLELVAALERSSKEDIIAVIKDVPVDRRKELLVSLMPYEALSNSQGKMAQALVAAASDGSLQSALARRTGTQVKVATAKAPTKPAAKADAKALNVKARKNLLEGLKKGTLEALVQETEDMEANNATKTDSDVPAPSQALMQALAPLQLKTTQALVAAASDGSLQSALARMNGIQALSPSQGKMTQALVAAASDGSLQSALARRAETQARPESAPISAQRCESELAVEREGDAIAKNLLGALLSTPPDSEPAKALSPSQVKMTQALVAAASDGSLQSALASRAGTQAQKTAAKSPVKPAARPDAKALNMKARKNLIEGLKKGTLEALVQDTEAMEAKNATESDNAAPVQSQAACLRQCGENLRIGLLKSTQGGQLAGVCQTTSESWSRDLARFKSNLVKAEADGSLAKHLVDLAAAASSSSS